MAASEHISVRQFGMLAHDPVIEKDVGNRMQYEHFETRRIRLESLRATQPTVSREVLDNYTARPRSSTHRPLVVRRNGENVIWDGHHRMAAALGRGQKTMTVEYQAVR